MASQHPETKNYITTHSLEDGTSIFLPDSQVSSSPTYKKIGPTQSRFATLGLAHQVPVCIDPTNSHNDISALKQDIKTETAPASVPKPGGIAFRRTDTPPGGTSPMHRTLTVDYAVIVSGEIELELEGGEKRLLKQGDTIVQRATMHRWKNPSETEWARMVVVMVPIEEPTEMNGKVLKEEFRVPGAH